MHFRATIFRVRKNSIVPPELADLIERLKEVKAGKLVDDEELEQLVDLARDVEKYLKEIATPRTRPDKTDTRSGWAATYHENTEEAKRALPLARSLTSAIRSRKWEAALTEANAVQSLFA